MTVDGWYFNGRTLKVYYIESGFWMNESDVENLTMWMKRKNSKIFIALWFTSKRHHITCKNFVSYDNQQQQCSIIKIYMIFTTQFYIFDSSLVEKFITRFGLSGVRVWKIPVYRQTITIYEIFNYILCNVRDDYDDE